MWPPRWVAVWSSRAILRALSSSSSNRTCKMVSSGGGGSTGRRLSPSTCVWDFPGWCFTVNHTPPVRLTSGGEERIPFALSSAIAKRSGRCRPQMVFTSNKVGTLQRPQTMARHSNLVAGYAFSAWLREREAQQMMRSVVDTSVYSRKGRLKLGKAVMGLVVRSVLRRLKAFWQSELQWKTASLRVRE